MVIYAYTAGNSEVGNALEHFVGQTFNTNSRSELWSILGLSAPEIPNRHPNNDTIPSLPVINMIDPLPVMRGDDDNADGEIKYPRRYPKR